jgi:hypothetical protein
MSELLHDGNTVDLLTTLWRADDREAGIAIVELPEPLRDESLLSACHGAKLIEFIRRNHCRVGPVANSKLVLEKGWNVAALYAPGRKPIWQLTREALSEQVDNRLRLRVRLSSLGCDAAATLITSDRRAVVIAESREPVTPVKLDADSLRIRIDGHWHDLSDAECDMLQILIEAKGEWVPGRTLGNRPDKIRKQMDEPVATLIESHQRHGYRIPSLLPQ